jgi:hypothetical protein
VKARHSCSSLRPAAMWSTIYTPLETLPRRSTVAQMTGGALLEPAAR